MAVSMFQLSKKEKKSEGNNFLLIWKLCTLLQLTFGGENLVTWSYLTARCAVFSWATICQAETP